MNAETGQWVETAHFGHLQHENIVPTKLSKWFFLTTDDDFRPGFDAYLYAYIANSFSAAISGDPSKEACTCGRPIRESSPPTSTRARR